MVTPNGDCPMNTEHRAGENDIASNVTELCERFPRTQDLYRESAFYYFSDVPLRQRQTSCISWSTRTACRRQPKHRASPGRSTARTFPPHDRADGAPRRATDASWRGGGDPVEVTSRRSPLSRAAASTPSTWLAQHCLPSIAWRRRATRKPTAWSSASMVVSMSYCSKPVSIAGPICKPLSRTI